MGGMDTGTTTTTLYDLNGGDDAKEEEEEEYFDEEYVDDLENEINVYEYEDDEWLDESESLSGSNDAPNSPDASDEEEEEIEDKTTEFVLERIFIEELTVRKDVTLDFIYDKTSMHADRKGKMM